MAEMDDMNNAYIENDKTRAPFLLAASFNGLIHFEGRYTKNGILYWQFSPKDKSLKLLDQFETKTEPHLPAKNVFQAIETWWRQIAELRNGGMKDGTYI